MNGKVASLGDSADPSVDTIEVDGERLRAERRVHWLVNKPRGVLTTTADPWARREGRRTVLDLLPDGADERVFPVGRLDAESEGLVLLTNDGELTHALLHPSLGNEREYRVTVKGEPDDAALERLRRGLRLDDGATAGWKVRRLGVDESAGRTRLEVVLREGRKHQIRRAFQALGHPVHRLVRTRMGPLRLGGLPAGRARPLDAEECEALDRHARDLRESAQGRSQGRAPKAGPKGQGAVRGRRGRPRRR